MTTTAPTTPKERPILFSAPMIRALLDGRKTQTRRVVRWKYWDNSTPQTPIEQVDQFADIVEGLAENLSGSPVPFCDSKCPYGKPGDRLWVRETFAMPEDVGEGPDGDMYYRATDPGWDDNETGLRWRPSIHMPRWASRITLEVTGVRVQRLQDMTETDAIDEGAMTLPNRPTYEAECAAERAAGRIKPPLGDSPLKRFATLWEQINGAGSWAANPWVWVITFRKL